MGTTTEQAPRVALFTVPEVAGALRLTPKAVYNRVESGELRAVRLGSGPRAPVRIPASELARYLATRSLSSV